jgi:hypothetical protein
MSKSVSRFTADPSGSNALPSGWTPVQEVFSKFLRDYVELQSYSYLASAND